MRDIYQDFYRSSDDKMLAGVCGGLAHRMNLNAGGLRFIFFITAFLWVGAILYIGLWLVLKPTPTKNIPPTSN